MSSLSYGHKTDVGRCRKNNQDNLVIVEGERLGARLKGLFVVADGMGGQAGGEIASQLTVETVPATVQEVLAEYNGHVRQTALAEAIREAIFAANEVVWQQARAEPALRGMGTTCVAALVSEGIAALGNVGDSRIYLLRAGELIQLTHDHSLVQEHVRAGQLTPEEARESRFRNVITRAIGIAGSVEPDIELIDLLDGDTLLLCSDGLTTMVSDADIAHTLATCPDAQEACERLVDAANENGGADNITAIVVRCGDFQPFAAPVRVSSHEAAFAGDRDPFLPQPPGQEEFAERPVPRSAGRLTATLLILLVFLQGAALLSIGRDQYETTGGWPPLRRKTPPKPVVQKPVPPPDFGEFLYAAPKIVLNKPIRSAPIACDPAGYLYVTTETGKIKRVSPKGEIQGDFLAPVKAARPAETYWAVDSQGYLYVSVKADRCIYKYAPNGTRKAIIGEGELDEPTGIAVDGSGNLYVADKNRLKAIKAHLPSSKEGIQILRRSGLSENPSPSERLTSEPRTLIPQRRTPLSVEERDGSR